MHKIAAVINGVAYDAFGVQISNADISGPLKREVANRNDTIEQIRLLQSDIEGPQNCQQHDAD